MFSDLVGSTALSAHMDPEDLREIIERAVRAGLELITAVGVLKAARLDACLAAFRAFFAYHDLCFSHGPLL
jgi:phosphoribosylcarboxyaminoimidazole (NCAIR) mutase